MSDNLPERLRQSTTAVADAGDFQAIEKFRPRDATTNPSLTAVAPEMPQCREVADETLPRAKSDAGAGASLISPFVGRILGWHKKEPGGISRPTRIPASCP